MQFTLVAIGNAELSMACLVLPTRSDQCESIAIALHLDSTQGVDFRCVFRAGMGWDLGIFWDR